MEKIKNMFWSITANLIMLVMLTAALLASCQVVTAAETCTAGSLDAICLEKLAMQGDYQAQRNLAYGYASDWPAKNQASNPILGCAWYEVILNSGNPKVNPSDISNVEVYCGKLGELSVLAATAQARKLYTNIYKKPAKF